MPSRRLVASGHLPRELLDLPPRGLDPPPQGFALRGLLIDTLLQGFDLLGVPPLFRLELRGQLPQGCRQLPF